MKLTVQAFRGPAVRDRIWVFLDRINGMDGYAGRPVEFKKIENGELYRADSEPTFELDTTAAQQLMDSLWDCGIRPSEGSGSAGCLAATERHLRDMREIAFNKLKITVSGEQNK